VRADTRACTKTASIEVNNTNKTTSILQRLPVILAVTAASYGLPAQAQAQRSTTPTAQHMGAAPQQPAAQPRR